MYIEEYVSDARTIFKYSVSLDFESAGGGDSESLFRPEEFDPTVVCQHKLRLD